MKLIDKIKYYRDCFFYGIAEPDHNKRKFLIRMQAQVSKGNFYKRIFDFTNYASFMQSASFSPRNINNLARNIKNIEDLDYFPGLITFQTWKHISRRNDLTISFINKYAYSLDWLLISSASNLNEKIMDEFPNLVHWDIVSFYHELSDNFLKKYKSKLNWRVIYNRYPKLPNEFILENADSFGACIAHVNYYTTFINTNTDVVLCMFSNREEITLENKIWLSDYSCFGQVVEMTPDKKEIWVECSQAYL